MKIYKLACICTLIVLLSGCNAFSSKTEEPSTKVASEVIKNEPVVLDTTHKEENEETLEGFHPLEIDAEIISPIGENISYFTYAGRVPFKISLLNTGTESFLYKIRNVDTETYVANGVLKRKESFEQVFDGLPKGNYDIYAVVEEEEPPIDIKLKVKVELLQ
ncbi:hypothetical protein [Lysinibacillus parviboronicapiens]|uniref:hypothetical protein n=1 Tax=Lysinibacillus parviboronicapiens TaxID=436516 RepID=UPI000D35238C|nr:hypothetical protein [Lysinibacillus parviboronicapiens]